MLAGGYCELDLLKSAFSKKIYCCHLVKLVLELFFLKFPSYRQLLSYHLQARIILSTLLKSMSLVFLCDFRGFNFKNTVT